MNFVRMQREISNSFNGRRIHRDKTNEEDLITKGQSHHICCCTPEPSF